jgi:hypothetical protein
MINISWSYVESLNHHAIALPHFASRNGSIEREAITNIAISQLQ